MQDKIVCEISYIGHIAYSEYSDAYGLNSIKEKNLKILKDIAWEK